MSVETPAIHDGMLTMSTAADYRNSTLTGTTLSGPSGSGQFLLMSLSTVNSLQCQPFNTSTNNYSVPYGICQNKPGPGQVADLAIFGVCKAVTSSTVAIAVGTFLMGSTTTNALVAYSSAAGVKPCAIARESVSAGSSGTVLSVGFGAFGQGVPLVGGGF